jgi:hypothetical protein
MGLVGRMWYNAGRATKTSGLLFKDKEEQRPGEPRRTSLELEYARCLGR